MIAYLLLVKKDNIPVPKMIILESGLTLSNGLKKEHYYINYYKELGYNILNKGKTGLGSGSIGALGKGKWNFKKCYEAATKCESLKEFTKKYGGALRVAKRNGWVKNYTWFNKGQKKEKGYYTFEICKSLADKCKSRGEFFIKHNSAYTASYRHKWLDILFEKKILKIDVNLMQVVGEYKKVSDITNDKTIYRVLEGSKQVFKDGYMYRKNCDVVVNKENKIITDLLQVKSKKEKKYEKYKFVIDLIKNEKKLNITQIYEIAVENGIKIAYPTCRKLKNEYCL